MKPAAHYFLRDSAKYAELEKKKARRIGPGENELVSGSGNGYCSFCGEKVKSTECGWIWHAHMGYWWIPTTKSKRGS